MTTPVDEELPQLTVELALNGGADPWEPVPNTVLGFDTSKGASRIDGVTVRYEPGRATVTFDNTNGALDPLNLSGPYVAAGRSLLRPRLGIRLRADYDDPTVEPLFTGFIRRLPRTYMGSTHSQVTFTAVDGSFILQGFDGTEQSPQGAGEDSGARIVRIADNAQWPDELRDIDTGKTTVQATTLAGNAWTEMLLTADTENGELYFDGWGNLRFRNRHAMLLEERSAVSQGTFGDRRPDLPWASVVINDDDDQLRNRIRIARAGGTVQEVEDLDSQLFYSYDGEHLQPATWGRTDLIMQTDLEALSFAQFALLQTKDAELRFDEMVIEPQSNNPAALFPQVLVRKLGDRITGRLHTPDGRLIERDVFIRGIKHNASQTRRWTTTWVLQDASRFAFFVLDDPILGVLDSNALGY